MTKISDLSALTGAGVDAANDLVTVVDVSATGVARNKKMTFAELALAVHPASAAQGDIGYFNGTAWVRLAAGTSGYFLKTQGAAANPVWAAPAAATYAPPASSTQTGTSYTAVIGDANTFVRFTNGSAVTFTIPPNSSVAFPVDTEIHFSQSGSGALSVAAGAGVTINSRSSDLTLAGQYAVGFVKQVAIDTWIMNGDL